MILSELIVIQTNAWIKSLKTTISYPPLSPKKIASLLTSSYGSQLLALSLATNGAMGC